jgi:hypothetical protein
VLTADAGGRVQAITAWHRATGFGRGVDALRALIAEAAAR